MNKFRIALIGNPNCGKTTLFNALTGSHQKVGNWPGVTVEKKTGVFTHGSRACEIVDLPGIYSLEQGHSGLDEKIAQDYLAAGEFDVIINIVDAANLQRNLVLTQQLLELGRPLVVAANMLDVAARQGITLDPAGLAEQLGVQVAPIIASRGRGLEALLEKLFCLQAAARVETQAAGDFVGEQIIRRYQKAGKIVDGVVRMERVEHTITERLDRWMLNRWLGIPVFLVMIYLMFTIAINLGAVFIDFFDILFAALLVDTPRWLLESAGAPAWLVVLLADGLGGGIRLVTTFIPVIGCLFLCLSLLESSGYMSRAAFVVDRLMAQIGLPGTAFVPLIVGFGCNVPAVMAARSLGRESDRLLTIAMAPFMSCGARLTVYALFAAALFPGNGQNLVFALYLLGICMAVLTGWLFRKQIFHDQVTPSFQEMPAYHVPVLRNILLTSWFRLKGFIFRAGKTIVIVVIGLSFLNSIGTDGGFGNENSDKSVLTAVGKTITPVFAPIGLREDNWPAAVGLLTGIFAKEAVVGTLDALYSRDDAEQSSGEQMPDILAAGVAAVATVKDNSLDLLSNLGDPLGIRLAPTDNLNVVAAAQGVSASTLTNMALLFGDRFAAFCYLVFVLLYAPCVAVLGAVAKEAGFRWMLLTFAWTTGLAYITATCVYQLGRLPAEPLASLAWITGCLAAGTAAVGLLRTLGRRSAPGNLITVVQV